MTTRWALVFAFVANGLGGPTFLARLPERQDELELSDGRLGLALLGLAFGALLSSAPSATLVRRYGSRNVTAGAGFGIALTLWLTAVAPSGIALFGALAVVGAADAAMDIAMNANGAAHEATTGRSILHRLHASWSLGALAGAASAAAAAALDIPMSAHFLAVGVLILVLSLAARPGLVAVDPEPEAATVERRARRLPAVLVVLGVATLVAALLEGTPGDWSAVQLARFDVSDGLAPLGTAAFMGGMLAGRLVGDRNTDRHGGTKVLQRGMALCAFGLIAGAASGQPLPFLVGVAVAGFGLSGFFPLAFSAASRVTGVAGGAGAAVVSLAARAGFLIEPPIVGNVAEAFDLRWSFVLAGVVAAGIALAAPKIVPR